MELQNTINYLKECKAKLFKEAENENRKMQLSKIMADLKRISACILNLEKIDGKEENSTEQNTSMKKQEKS